MYLDINENLILECLNELSKNAKDKQKYKDYYEGNHHSKELSNAGQQEQHEAGVQFST